MRFRKLIAGLLAGLLMTTAAPLSCFAEDTGTATAASSVSYNEDRLQAFLSSLQVKDDGTIVIAYNGQEYSLNLNTGTTTKKGVINSPGYCLRLRSGPGTNYEILDAGNHGDAVEILDKAGEWYKVKYNGKTGYMHQAYITVTESASTTDNSALIQALYAYLMQYLGHSSGTAAGLTPSGNLTLVDDLGSITNSGQQFITLVSKSGNTFYLVIDRNTKGEENVHFLNLVDEADLFALLDEDAQEEHLSHQTPTEPAPTIPVITEPQTEPEPVMTQEKDINWPLIMLLVIVVAANIGVFAYSMIQKKKQDQAANKPDPDADYEDDSEEYDFPDDEDYEEISAEPENEDPSVTSD